MTELRRENIYYPYDNVLQYYLFKNHAIPQLDDEKKITLRTSRNRQTGYLAHDVAFNSYNDFIGTADLLTSTQSPWSRKRLKPTPDSKSVEFWCRNPLDTLAEILENLH